MIQAALGDGKLPEGWQDDADLAGWKELIEDLIALRSFAQHLARGDLSVELMVKGQFAGALKTLQANLRHLTWQVQQVAEGDLSQRVEFMGEFSAAFNAMTENLRRAQADLRASEERYRRLVAVSPDVITIADLQGIIQFASPAARAIFKLESETEMVGRRVFDYIEQEYHNVVSSRLQSIIAGEPLNSVEYTLRRSDGSRFTAEIHTVSLCDEHNRPDSLVSIIRDISEQVERQRALRESEARYRLLAQNSHDVIWTMDLEGRFTYVSPSVEQLRGFGVEEVMKQSLEDAFTPESAQLVALSLDEAIAISRSGERVSSGRFELEQPCKNGGTVWTEASLNPLYDDAGNFTGFVGVSRDVTMQRQLQTAEREQRILAEALRDASAALNSAMDMDAVFDAILNIIYRVVPHNAIDIMLIEADGRAHIHRCQGYDRMYPGSQKIFEAITLPVETTANLREMLRTRQPCLIPDVRKVAGWVTTEYTGWIRSYLGAPIVLHGEVVGFIGLLSAQENFFTSEQADRLMTFADQAAIAIEKARLFAMLNQLATTDSLTGIANRRHFFDHGEREFSRAIRYGKQLSAMMLDIDHFKQVNDVYGHAAGDRVLQQLASLLLASLRQEDLLGRYGGEEFAILLPETPLSYSLAAAERLRQAVADFPFQVGDEILRITISAGVASLQDGCPTIYALLDQADQALYAAKQSGRNRVCAFSHSN